MSIRFPKVSPQQELIMVKFLEKHANMVGDVPKNPIIGRRVTMLWRILARKLNSYEDAMTQPSSLWAKTWYHKKKFVMNAFSRKNSDVFCNPLNLRILRLLKYCGEVGEEDINVINNGPVKLSNHLMKKQQVCNKSLSPESGTFSLINSLEGADMSYANLITTFDNHMDAHMTTRSLSSKNARSHRSGRTKCESIPQFGFDTMSLNGTQDFLNATFDSHMSMRAPQTQSEDGIKCEKIPKLDIKDTIYESLKGMPSPQTQSESCIKKENARPSGSGTTGPVYLNDAYDKIRTNCESLNTTFYILKDVHSSQNEDSLKYPKVSNSTCSHNESDLESEYSFINTGSVKEKIKIEEQQHEQKSLEYTAEALDRCALAIGALAGAINFQSNTMAAAIRDQGQIIAEALKVQGKMIAKALANR